MTGTEAPLGVVVDAHVHLVSTDRARYPLRPLGTGETWFEDAPVTAEAFRSMMDASGVSRAVLVQCMTAYSDDNRYALDVANADPERFACVVWVDAASPEAPATLSDLVARGASGVRVVTGTPRRPVPIDDAAAVALLDQADSSGIGIVVTILVDQLPGLRRVLEARPHLRIALDHCGFADLSGGAPYESAQPLRDLAAFPHVVCKVSNIVLSRAARADGGDPRPFVEHLAEHFGTERMMWASNYSETSRPYAESVARARQACERLATADRRRFLAETALATWPGRA